MVDHGLLAGGIGGGAFIPECRPLQSGGLTQWDQQ
jgi:hypothetical protein